MKLFFKFALYLLRIETKILLRIFILRMFFPYIVIQLTNSLILNYYSLIISYLLTQTL